MAWVNEVVEYANRYLRIGEIEDWPNALNGLQIENSGRITRIGAAVDASACTLTIASKRGVNFLVVHHGLFWPGLQPIIAGRQRLLKLAFEADLALYSAHLPLDIHPFVGNNAQLASSLGLEQMKPFFEAKGALIGMRTNISLARADLSERVERSLGAKPKLFASGPDCANAIGIITGGGGSEIYAVAREGIDTFITGEAPHWAAIAAEELGVNLILGGHYATETFGVKALGAHLSERFGVPWDFIDCPTGL